MADDRYVGLCHGGPYDGKTIETLVKKEILATSIPYFGEQPPNHPQPEVLGTYVHNDGRFDWYPWPEKAEAY